MKRILLATVISFAALSGVATAQTCTGVACTEVDADVSTDAVTGDNDVSVSAPIVVDADASGNRVLTSEDDHSVNDSYNSDDDQITDNSTRTNVQDSFNEDNRVTTVGNDNLVEVDHSGRTHNFDLQGTGSARSIVLGEPAAKPKTITLYPHDYADGKDYGVSSGSLPSTGVSHLALKLWGGLGMIAVGSILEMAGRRGPAIA